MAATRFIKTTTFALAFGSVSLSSMLATSAYSAAIDLIKPHRAVYDLKLGKASDRSGITSIKGRMVYEVKGSRCEGFSSQFRLFTEVQTARKNFSNDYRTTSFESGDGSSYDFVQQTYLNGQLEQDLRGRANRDDEQTVVILSSPDKKDATLGPSVFITEHVAMLIDAAMNEQTIVSTDIYDAAENGTTLVETTAIIGKRKSQDIEPVGETAEVTKQMAGNYAWPVTVSYFSSGAPAEGGEKLPQYQVSYLMHQDGVSRRLRMQYTDYSLIGDLKKLEYLKANSCE